MEMERALETQRLALLRLLAGLAAALRLVAFAPAVSLMPRWVQSYVASLLERLESAAHSLVIVTACGVLRRQGMRSMGGLSFPPLPVRALTEDASSCAALLRQINQLRAVLEDLPRHAKRMIRRMLRPKAKPRVPSVYRDVCAGILVVADAPIVERIERPPDKRQRADVMDFGFTPS